MTTFVSSLIVEILWMITLRKIGETWVWKVRSVENPAVEGGEKSGDESSEANGDSFTCYL